MLYRRLKEKVRSPFLSYFSTVLIGAGSLFAQSLFACGTSVTCGDTSTPTTVNGITYDNYTCTLNYCSDLSYETAYDGTKVAGEMTGKYTAQVAIQETTPACIYFQVTANDNTVASAEGYSYNVIKSGVQTSWCQYLGTEMNCPFENLGGYNVETSSDGADIDLDNTFAIQLDVAPTETPVTLEFDWTFSGSASETIDCVPLSADGKGTISVPSGNFEEFVTSNLEQDFSQAIGCVPPSS